MLPQCLFNGLSMSLVDHQKFEPTAGTFCNFFNNIDSSAPLLAFILHASPCQHRPSVRTSAFRRHAFTLLLLCFHHYLMAHLAAFLSLFPLFFPLHTKPKPPLLDISANISRISSTVLRSKRAFISTSEMLSCYGRLCCCESVWPCLCCSDADVFMVAGRGGVKKNGRKPSALEELFGNTSDSEASTFRGFEDAELEDILFSDDDGAVDDS